MQIRRHETLNHHMPVLGQNCGVLAVVADVDVFAWVLKQIEQLLAAIHVRDIAVIVCTEGAAVT
jgi:hypothetical protein